MRMNVVEVDSEKIFEGKQLKLSSEPILYSCTALNFKIKIICILFCDFEKKFNDYF